MSSYEKQLDLEADKFCGGVNLRTGTDEWISGERCFKSGADFGREYERERSKEIVGAFKAAVTAVQTDRPVGPAVVAYWKRLIAEHEGGK